MTLKNLDLSILKNRDIELLHQPSRKKKKKDDAAFEYFYVGNIPISYRSADLRYFFTDFIEKRAFKCFHYRHRPEKQVIIKNKVTESCQNDTCTSTVDLPNSGRNDVLPTATDKELVSHTTDNNNKNLSTHVTCCCMIAVYSELTEQFIKKYNGKEWRSKDLEFLKRTVNIKKINLKSRPCHETTTYKSNREKEIDNHMDNQELYSEDISSSIELGPPEYILPNGNIGTTTQYFHGLIKECKMPPSLIKSLAIEFPKSRKNKAYSNVPLNYEEKTYRRPSWSTTEPCGTPHGNSFHTKHTHLDNSAVDFLIDKPCDDSELVKDGQCESNKTIFSNSKTCETKSKSDQKEFAVLPDLGIDPVDDQTNDDILEIPDEEDDAEDWERHEALHDDCDNQSRPKERLFEEDMEVTWEKGGSGLVFYTDSYYWDKMKGSDFDADTTDDWDVDYSIYYEDGAGDKPARDQLQMRIEQRRRRGEEDGPIKPSQLRRMEKSAKYKMNTNFAEFEKYSKGFGSRILKEQGWTEGSGVGPSGEGITEPLTSDGQKPSERIGLGYYGEKLDRTINLKKKVERDVRISTKYDERDGDHVDAMQFHGLELLKYWDRYTTTAKNCNDSDKKKAPVDS